MKLRMGNYSEADITPCIQCSDCPPMSDWSSRPRYWPSAVEAQRIISLGCHLVAKPTPSGKEETSWRFSFPLAEVELSKLVPNTARKCFLFLKITFSPGQLGRVFHALVSMNCPHHWFSFINSFDIEAKKLQRLARKVERIMKDPAPFIFDDGCCCLSPCCVRVPHYNSIRRSREQSLVDYDELTLTADGNIMVVPGNQRHQLPTSLSPRSEGHLASSTYSTGNHGREITAGPEELVLSLPPIQNSAQERSFRPGDKLSVPLQDS
ncbi:hypothetical protein ACROYT_G016841 [Oculina patagonica]